MYPENYNCVLCHLGTEESLLRFFLHCPFAMSCWNTLGLAHLIIQGDILQSFSAFKVHPHRPFFMKIIVSMCWAIWTARNDVIFKKFQHSMASCKITFHKELALAKLRARSHYQPLFDQWLDNFV